MSGPRPQPKAFCVESHFLKESMPSPMRWVLRPGTGALRRQQFVEIGDGVAGVEASFRLRRSGARQAWPDLVEQAAKFEGSAPSVGELLRVVDVWGVADSGDLGI